MKKPVIPTITETVEYFDYEWPEREPVHGEGPIYLTWGFYLEAYWLQHETALIPHSEAHICTKEGFEAEAARLQASNKLDQPIK